MLIGTTRETDELAHDFIRSLVVLQDTECELLWDSIDLSSGKRKSFTADEVEAALALTATVGEEGAGLYSSFHVLATEDESGRLLERGMIAALRTQSDAALEAACFYFDKLPATPGAELCELILARESQRKELQFRLFHGTKIKSLLKRCAEKPREAQ